MMKLGDWRIDFEDLVMVFVLALVWAICFI